MRRIFQLTLLVAWLAPMTAVAAQQNQPPPRQQTSDNGTTKQSHYGQHPPYNNAAQPSQSGSATQGAAGGTQASAFSPPARSGMQRLQNVPVNRYNQISPMAPNIQNPLANSKAAVVEGKRLFKAMNCAGCHAPGGGGGMGPALSDSVWVYGDTPADIYLSIMHGRPGGMPAWGGALPPQAIWALVTYVKTLPRPRTGYKVESKLTGPAKQAVPKAEIPKKRPSQLPSAHPPDKQSNTTQPSGDQG